MSKSLEKRIEEAIDTSLEDTSTSLGERRKLKRNILKQVRQERREEWEGTSVERDLTRRKFLKMLGIGTGGLALSSSAAGLFKITDQPQTSTINADTVDGIEAAELGASAGDNLSKSGNTLNVIDGSGSGLDADTLDGKDSTAFVETNDSIDADTLDGKDSTAFVETNDSIDADTLNGQSASDLGGGVISTFVAVGVNEGNINDGRNIDWSNETVNTGSYSFDGRNITIPSNGVYEVRSDIDFNSGNQSRANPNIFIQKNGSTVGVGGRSGYMRDSEGHNHSSIHASFIGSLSSGDDIRVRASREADGGDVDPERGHVYIKRIE